MFTRHSYTTNTNTDGCDLDGLAAASQLVLQSRRNPYLKLQVELAAISKILEGGVLVGLLPGLMEFFGRLLHALD